MNKQTIAEQIQLIIADIQTAQYKLADMKITAADIKIGSARLKLEKLEKDLKNGMD